MTTDDTTVNLTQARERYFDKGLDPDLEAAVASAIFSPDQVESGPEVVLFVGGAILAGEVIPAWQWVVERHRSKFVGARDSEEEQKVEAALDEIAAHYKKPLIRRSELEAREDDPTEDEKQELFEPVRFLNLRNARYVSPAGNVPTNGGVYMRVRATSIDAWAEGTLSSDS